MSRAPRTRLPGAYWRLFAGSAVSNIGDGVLVAALPLLAARTTGHEISVGLISTFFTIPWLLFALPVGALMDRWDRRRVLVVADFYRAVLVGGLAAVAAWGQVETWMLWVMAFGLGAGEVFFDSASMSVVPMIVPADRLERANGWRYSAEIAANTFVGLPVGSLLFAAAVWLPFGLDAASFAVAALLATTLRGRFRPTAGQGADTTRATVRTELRAGIGWLRRHRVLWSMAIALALTNLAFALTESTFVLFAIRELGVGERFFGVVIAMVGLGAFAAGMVGERVVRRVGRRFVILVAALVPVLTLTGIGLFPRTWWVVTMTTVQALTTTMWSVVSVSLRQQLVPAELFGRVNGVYRWLAWGAMPIGAFLGGVVANGFGLRAPYFVAAAVLLVAYAIVVRRLTAAAIDAAVQAST